MSESVCVREQSFRQSETIIEREGASEKEEEERKTKRERERERGREEGRARERETKNMCIYQNQKETRCVYACQHNPFTAQLTCRHALTTCTTHTHAHTHMHTDKPAKRREEHPMQTHIVSCASTHTHIRASVHNHSSRTTHSHRHMRTRVCAHTHLQSEGPKSNPYRNTRFSLSGRTIK